MKLIMENWRNFNEDERTIIAYHGSKVPIENFSRDFGAQGVMWFSENKDKILQGESGACSSEYIMKVELTVDKPAGWDEYDKLALQQIEDEGYDSIKLDDDWVVFEPRRVKVIDVEEPTCSLNEGITDVVFHKTRLDLAADILKSDKFMTSVAFGTPADKQQNKGKLYYLSTMRSPVGDYGPGLPAVTFKLDGRKLGERSKAAAVDYWGPNFPKDEMEDRVFTDDPYLEPATKYITEIHVGLPIGDKYRKMRPARIEEAEAVATAGEGAGIPVYFYANEKTYGILNKTKRLTLDQWKQAFKKSGEELDEPWDYESRPYKSSLLSDVAQMIQGFESGNVDDIEKGHRSEWYNIKYDSQFGGRGLSERASQLQVAIHNAKAKPHAREVIHLIGRKVKELGGLQEVVNWIQQEIKKWDGEQELKQVAEAHGFLNEVAIGQCYPHAVKMAQSSSKEEFRDLTKFKVVHGRITDKWTGESVKHAWVEKADTIFDWQTHATKPEGIDRGTYYEQYQPEIYNEYTAEETMVNCVKQGQPGPWANKQ